MNEADLQLIEHYLSGRMTPAEVQNFEKRLVDDTVLQQTLAQYRQQDNYLAYRANGGLLPQNLDQLAKEAWMEENPDTQKSSSGRIIQAPGQEAKRRPIRRYLSLAAAIAVLLLAGWWLLSPEQKLNGPELYASQMVIPRLDFGTRGSADPVDSLYRLAVETYSSGNYANARPLLDNYLENYELDSELLLAYAVASLEENEFTEAEIALRSLAESGSLLSGEVPFYRALSQLKQGNIAAARDIVRELPEGDQKLEQLKLSLGL